MDLQSKRKKVFISGKVTIPSIEKQKEKTNTKNIFKILL
ncbi:MAG: hypothetical protein K0R51_1383 [Cytophagaceae bacterium]|jgi:hypothetical protein|nr:hypothetical protein [Cytophagaceae bacterium]